MKVKDLERLGGILPTDEVLVVTAEGIGPILVPYSAIQNGTGEIVKNPPVEGEVSSVAGERPSLDDYDPDIPQDYEISMIDSEPDVDALISELALAAHPVGSYYWSNLSADPATLFGGTWTRVTGRFLWGREDSEPVGATGGAKTVALTEATMPAHTHAGLSNVPSSNHRHTYEMGSHTHTISSHSHTLSHNHASVSHSHTYLPHTHGMFYGLKTSQSEASGYGAYPGGSYAYLVELMNGMAQVSSGTPFMSSTASSTTSGTSTAKTTAPSSSTSKASLTSSLTTNVVPNVSFMDNAVTTGPEYSLTIHNSGKGSAHENMPPYLNAYCWRRTA